MEMAFPKSYQYSSYRGSCRGRRMRVHNRSRSYGDSENGRGRGRPIPHFRVFNNGNQNNWRAQNDLRFEQRPMRNEQYLPVFSTVQSESPPRWENFDNDPIPALLIPQKQTNQLSQTFPVEDKKFPSSCNVINSSNAQHGSSAIRVLPLDLNAANASLLKSYVTPFIGDSDEVRKPLNFNNENFSLETSATISTAWAMKKVFNNGNQNNWRAQNDLRFEQRPMRNEQYLPVFSTVQSESPPRWENFDNDPIPALLIPQKQTNQLSQTFPVEDKKFPSSCNQPTSAGIASNENMAGPGVPAQQNIQPGPAQAEVSPAAKKQQEQQQCLAQQQATYLRWQNQLKMKELLHRLEACQEKEVKYKAAQEQQKRQQHRTVLEQQNAIKKKRSVSDGGTMLYVSNLHYRCSEQDISDLFSEFGPLQKTAIHHDNWGNSRCTADVVFKEFMHAANAMKQYHGAVLDGRHMNIQMVTGMIPYTKGRSGGR